VGFFIRKAMRFLSKQGQLQVHFHSKARELSTYICKTVYSLSFDVFKVGFPALAAFEGSFCLFVAFSSVRVCLGFFGLVKLWLEYQGSDQEVGI